MDVNKLSYTFKSLIENFNIEYFNTILISKSFCISWRNTNRKKERESNMKIVRRNLVLNGPGSVKVNLLLFLFSLVVSRKTKDSTQLISFFYCFTFLVHYWEGMNELDTNFRFFFMGSSFYVVLITGFCCRWFQKKQMIYGWHIIW